ncbi:MAG: hypothetical protein VXX85_03400, partial [Candidatus Margulisiibacteriota bacterium]|nr:hypothetical protein [Candidatus Margulisiibacteriota bacterium]
GINEEAINYAEKMYFKGISKKISILEKALTLPTVDQELNKELKELKEQLHKAPSEAFYDALTQFDFEVKKENARTEPVSQKTTLNQSYKEFASKNGIPLTMANKMLIDHANSKLEEKLGNLLDLKTIKSLQKKPNNNSSLEYIRSSLRNSSLPNDTKHDSFLESVITLRKRQLNGQEHRQELADIESLEKSINKVKKNIILKYKLNDFRSSGTNRRNEDGQKIPTIFSENYKIIKEAIDEYNNTLNGVTNPETFIQELSERYHLSV